MAGLVRLMLFAVTTSQQIRLQATNETLVQSILPLMSVPSEAMLSKSVPGFRSGREVQHIQNVHNRTEPGKELLNMKIRDKERAGRDGYI